MCAAPSQGRGRRSPETKNNNVNDILSGAKKNFLSATDGAGDKTPVKREPEVVPSPKSLLKHPSISLGTPEKNKQPKFWKTRWQEKVNGRLNEGRGKKRRGNEADKLLGDEGVIQMLNKVPSVFGVMPRSASNTSNRVQRVRAVASKSANTASTAAKQGRAAVKRHGSTDSKKTKLDSKTVKQEPVAMSSEPSSSSSGGFVSPKRTVRNISKDFTHQGVVGSMVSDEDSFSHLTELSSEQLESLMNCDIRFSLPKQGAPVQTNPSKQSKKEDVKDSKGRPSSRSHKSSPEASSSSSSDRSSAAVVQVNPVSLPSSFSKHASLKLPPVPLICKNQNNLKEVIQFDSSEPVDSSDSLGPGQFSQIHLRLWDTWAQISLTSTKTRLRGSLNPDIIEEITHALGYVSSVSRFRGVLITGVGNVFCQGVDLHFLCSDHQERRKAQAGLMAAAVERLVLTLSTFPKLLVAAVNGDTTGLGVTLLPLFDIVYANDKATFNTYYSRLGQIPEGGASATLPQFTSGLGGALAAMLLMSKGLTASEMAAAGLVTDTFFPGRLMEEVVPRMKRACSQQNLGLQWNKLLLKQHQKSQVEKVIGGETELLTEIWSSRQFHVSLVNFINTEKCLQFQKPL